MARNRRKRGGRRIITHEETNVDFSTQPVTVTLNESRHINSREDVRAHGYGTSDAEVDAGYVITPVNVSSNTVDLRGYQQAEGNQTQSGNPPNSGALNSTSQSDVDHVIIEAEVL